MKKGIIWVGLVIMLLPGIVGAADWTEKVKVKGDLRYRHEMIKVEGNDARNRHRIRARIGIEANPADSIKLGFQLASGSDDPVSRNQTLGDTFTAKGIWLDLAYVDLHTDQAPGLNIIAGKMKNPFHKVGSSELIWDSDFNPEGGVLKYVTSNDRAEFFANVGGFWVEERGSDCDTWLFGGQAGVDIAFAEDKGNIGGGFSYYGYGNIKGYGTFYDDDSFGNTLDEGDNYMYDYQIIEFFAELGFKVEDFPLQFFFDYVKNVAENVEEDQGWLVGGKFGKTKDPGSIAFRYIYREIEADAVFATFNDSDFNGGGTDCKGSEFGFDVQVAKAWTASMTYFLNERSANYDTPNFNRLQLDAAFKF
ncbi:MAG: putative porin [Acidobacteria bacterium]|nr:putative porin [Acidobacteriota bacterium]